MLKIVKKEDIQPEKTECRYTLQDETEEKILKVVRDRQSLTFQDVEAYIDHLPSIAAALLAEIIQKVLANLQEGNIDESVAFILKLVGLHHDERELRHYLKHKFRVDATIFLLILWDRREETLAIYLVNLVLDCYTVQLMLNGKEILKSWKNYIANRILYLQSREQVHAKLQQQHEQKEIKTNSNFRRIVIPL